MEFQFTHQIPGNSGKLKKAFFSMLIFAILCFIGVAIALAFWDEYTYPAVNLKGVHFTGGWPATLYGWGLWMGIGFILFLPFLFFMQDWKNPSLGLTREGLFINQQMFRNVHIPFSEIREIINSDKGYQIKFKDNQIVLKQIGLFKPFVKSNLENGNFFITNIHSSGDIPGFFVELNKKLG